MKNSALVVIDLQNDITKNYREIIGRVNEAIDWAAREELWVVYIRHNNLSPGTRTFKPGTHGAELVPELNVVSDRIFTKTKSSALTCEAFAAFLQERGIAELYIAGADAAACIKSTCFNLAKSGYAVHVLADCITSYDKKKLPELLAYPQGAAAGLLGKGTLLRRMTGGMEAWKESAEKRSFSACIGSTGGDCMKKLYEKNELTFAIAWIVAYCVLQSLANPLNELIGVGYAASAAFCVVQTAVLFAFLRRNGLQERYGLCRSPIPARRFLYYVPLVILASGNLWNGVALNASSTETVCHIVCMLCVGFLEEVIFRGLLFTAIARDNLRSAVIISSVTFGAGHVINLFNGSGMELWSNLCQIVFAVAMGFLLVTIFYRGGSLIPCILVHSAINTLSAFADHTGSSVKQQLMQILAMLLIAVAYDLILTKTLPERQPQCGMSTAAKRS